MQNPQMAAMAGMNAQVGGPVEGTPVMGNMPRPGQKPEQPDPRNLMNTYIYDYFMRNNHYRLARCMIESDLKMNLQPQGTKQSPGSRNVNGVDGMDTDDKGDLPLPVLPPGQCVENSFLMDWWCQFWDIYSAARGKGTQKSTQYSQHARVRSGSTVYRTKLTVVQEYRSNAERPEISAHDDERYERHEWYESGAVQQPHEEHAQRRRPEWAEESCDEQPKPVRPLPHPLRVRC
jgi:hypothetical protein